MKKRRMFGFGEAPVFVGDALSDSAGLVGAGLCTYYGGAVVAKQCDAVASEWASSMEEGISGAAQGAGCHSDDPNAWCNAPPPEQTRGLCPAADAVDQAIAPILQDFQALSGFDWSSLPAGSPGRAIQSFAYIQCQHASDKLAAQAGTPDQTDQTTTTDAFPSWSSWSTPKKVGALAVVGAAGYAALVALKVVPSPTWIRHLLR